MTPIASIPAYCKGTLVVHFNWGTLTNDNNALCNDLRTNHVHVGNEATISSDPAASLKCFGYEQKLKPN